MKDARVGILLCQGKIGYDEGHRHSEITQRDKNQEFGKTYLIKKSSICKRTPDFEGTLHFGTQKYWITIKI